MKISDSYLPFSFCNTCIHITSQILKYIKYCSLIPLFVFCIQMFSTKNNVKSMLFYASTDVAKSFMFEVAMHWAEEGRRVVYITSAPLTSIPAIYHDRKEPSPTSFNMIKFIYLTNYEELVEQLMDLHTHAVLPAIILIDNLHIYIEDPQIKEQQDVHIAKLCAIIHDSIIACSRIKKTKLYLCASVTSTNSRRNVYSLYFNEIWKVDTKHEDDVTIIELRQIQKKNESAPIFKYKQFQDGTLILDQIFDDCEEY